LNVEKGKERGKERERAGQRMATDNGYRDLNVKDAKQKLC